MLNISNLHVSVEGKKIIRGLNLNINSGEIHVIMGPNGSGKSTLSNTLAGKDKYTIDSGEIVFNNSSIIEKSPEDRACEGIFLSFQYPASIAGVNNMYFLRAALNSIQKFNDKEEIDSSTFLRMIREKIEIVGLDESFIKRSVNVGFSGGEKKRNEILQMIMLDPKLAILDETDSGLDIDALKIVANGINGFMSKDKGILLITHYQRILDYLSPDYIHVLLDGEIVKSGDKDLAQELEKKGYSWIRELSTT